MSAALLRRSRLGGCAARSRRAAFTLVELLVVMAIIVLLAAITLPAIKGPLEGVNLTGSLENVTAVFSLARQTAIARNIPVEVRIYKKSASGRSDWNTIALLIPATVSGRASDEWVGAPTSLSGNVIIDPGKSTKSGADGDASDFSSIVTQAHEVTAQDANPQWPQLVLKPKSSAPPQIQGLDYVAFRFLADGSTNLPETPVVPPGQTSDGQQLRWCLSLRNYTAPAFKDGAIPAANFAALVIDPATGRVLVFRS